MEPDDEPEACQNCGKLIFGDTDGYDDVCSAPYVTKGGDLYCIPCGRSHDEAQRQYDEESAVAWMDDPYECSPPSDPPAPDAKDGSALDREGEHE